MEEKEVEISFLLIVRGRRIVTPYGVPRHTRMFQHIAMLYHCYGSYGCSVSFLVLELTLRQADACSGLKDDFAHSVSAPRLTPGAIPPERDDLPKTAETPQCSRLLAIRASCRCRPPDKEFRYLRTVIVTAGVRQGLDRRHTPPHVTF
jgi:hypothetical protein